MATLNERIEANADLILWCVAVAGPDDVYAEPSHAAAVAAAEKLNKAIHRHNIPEIADVLSFAYAAPWPGSKESHAKNLAKQDAESAPPLSPEEAR